MRRVTTLAFVIFVIGQSSGQTKIEQLTKDQLPKNASIPGKTISIKKWSDGLGINYFVLSGTDEFKSPKGLDDDYRDKVIYMKHFVTSGQETKEVWRASDEVVNCPLDIELSFLEESPRITDLDNDGVYETWVVYHKGCHGDISPPEMTIIMTTRDKQYSLKGMRIADIGRNRKVGGEIYSNMFQQMSSSFNSYADSLWTKHKPWNY